MILLLQHAHDISSTTCSWCLPHLPLVPHICVSDLGQHWFRWWLVAYSPPSHYLNHAGLLLLGPLGTNFSEIFIKIQNFSFMKINLKIFSVRIAAILSRGDEFTLISLKCHGSEIVHNNFQHSWLTHWGWVTNICVGKLTIIGSDDGLLPGRCQAIIWTNAGISLIWPLATNFNEIWTEIQTF